MSTPAQLAAACFATARSTTHAGERDAALGRARAICRRHGLDEAALRDRPAFPTLSAQPGPFASAVNLVAQTMHAFRQRVAAIAVFEAACQEAAARDAARALAAELRGVGLHVHRLAPNEWLVPGSGDILVEIVDDAAFIEWARARAEAAAHTSGMPA